MSAVFKRLIIQYLVFELAFRYKINVERKPTYAVVENRGFGSTYSPEQSPRPIYIHIVIFDI